MASPNFVIDYEIGKYWFADQIINVQCIKFHNLNELQIHNRYSAILHNNSMKILDELRQDVEYHMKSQNRKSIERKYAKLTNDLKKILIHRVTVGGLSIREAAIALEINYTSAKSVLQQYRKRNNKTAQVSQRSSEYDWEKFRIVTFCAQQLISVVTFTSP